MNTSGIYQIQSIIKPERIYIGSATELNKRKFSHYSKLRKNIHCNIKLQRHYNKYGESDLIFTILITCEKEELIEKEQFFIDIYKPYFNIAKYANSPMLGLKHSEESKKKMSISGKNAMHTYWIGKHFTIEHRQKLIIKLKERKRNKMSEECKIKIGNKNRGKIRTLETKHKMSIKKQLYHPQKGKIGILSKLSKPIDQLDLNNVFISNWESINQCSLCINIPKSNIIMCLKGIIKQTHGFKFKYK